MDHSVNRTARNRDGIAYFGNFNNTEHIMYQKSKTCKFLAAEAARADCLACALHLELNSMCRYVLDDLKSV